MVEKYEELWDFIREEIRLVEDVKPFKYKKDFMKINFKSDDSVPVNFCMRINY